MIRLLSVLIVSFACTGFLLFQISLWNEEIDIVDKIQAKQYAYTRGALIDERREFSRLVSEKLAADNCISIMYSYDNEICIRSDERSFEYCLDQTDDHDLAIEPTCIQYAEERIATPEAVKAIYMTSYIAGNKTRRGQLLDLIKETELNSVIIDIKEVDGLVTFAHDDREIVPFQRNLMPDIEDFIAELHDHNVYVIARIVLFKDKAWAAAHPEHAIKRKDDSSIVWTDYGGKKYIDPGAEEFWDYLVGLGSLAYNMGFDEINADYIRYPSDGNMKNTYYPYSQDMLDRYGYQNGRIRTLNRFMDYFTSQLREKHPRIVISADVFGMVATNRDDLTIGQKLEPFLTHFDAVSPMVYPSHYPYGFVPLAGHPDNHPYEVVYKSESIAQKRLEHLYDLQETIAAIDTQLSDTTITASSTIRSTLETEKNNLEQELLALIGEDDPSIIPGLEFGELRPWLQDFTCTWCKGYFPYGSAQVREQIQATYDAGQTGWMLWSASNRYTRGALLEEETELLEVATASSTVTNP